MREERKKKGHELCRGAAFSIHFFLSWAFDCFLRLNLFLFAHVLVERILLFSLVLKPPFLTEILTSVTALWAEISCGQCEKTPHPARSSTKTLEFPFLGMRGETPQTQSTEQEVKFWRYAIAVFFKKRFDIASTPALVPTPWVWHYLSFVNPNPNCVQTILDPISGQTAFAVKMDI